MDVTEFVKSLRLLADWYEQHPELPLPYELGNPMFVFLYGKTEDRVKEILREIGSFEKVFDEPSKGDFSAVKTIGEFKLKFHTSREMVCTPRVVGTRLVEREVIPAQPKRVIEAHEEEIVEWDCHPILEQAATTVNE